MKISNISIKRPVTVIMVMLIVILLGVVSFSRLAIDLYPEINVPIAIISTNYSGVGPEEMENLVTKPLEGVLATVSGVTNLSSSSSEGSSLIIMEFDFGQDMESAALEMREKVDMIEGFLPEDASDPQVFKIDPNAFPIMSLSISSDKSLEETQRIAESKIISRLERIDGVASVNLTGGRSKIVDITIDENAANAFGLTFSQIKGMLFMENVNVPAGEVIRGTKELPLRIVGEFESVEEMQNLPLLLSSGQVIRLEDVADVKLVTPEAGNINRLDGVNSIGLSITKQTDANTVRVAEALRAEIEDLQDENQDVLLTVISDTAVFIDKSISAVSMSGILGGLLAILILYLFLRNIRTTFIIAISIPVSVIATFVLIYFSGITLNLMTLGGLALGLGMLVDNSIVVLENIYRYRDMGYGRVEAAREGAGEVSMAVVASTLTTIAVFLPIVFVEGITSLLFKELALTITFSLTASLVTALTVVPMLSSKILKIDHQQDEKRRFSYFDKVFHGVEGFYGKMVHWAIHKRKTTMALAVIIFAVSIALIGSIGAEFIPAMDEGLVQVNVEMPQGTSLEATKEVVDRLEAKLEGIEEIERVNTSIGANANSFMVSENSNIASITISLVAREEREISSFEMADRLRSLYEEEAGAAITVQATQTQGFGGMGAPIQVTLKGDNLDVLTEYADEIVGKIRNVEGTREVSSSLDEGTEELVLIIDREAASQYGLTGSTVSNYVRDLLYGTTVTYYKKDGEEITVRMKGDESYTKDINALTNVMIESPYGPVPLNAVIESLEIERKPIAINRDNQVRNVTISTDIFNRDLQSVSRDIEASLNDLVLPEGYEVEIGGQTEELIESFSSLILAFGLAVALVYMIMASQFENLKYPFIIMAAVPLSFAGSILGLFFTGRLLSVPAMIGVIMLAGIVVNNAIVLVDYINTLRSRGQGIFEAVQEASQTRLRPILMTTLTTILGLLPMAIGLGEGSETTAPLATVVIGGLLLSTVLTLVVIPVLYLIFNRKVVKAEERKDV